MKLIKYSIFTFALTALMVSCGETETTHEHGEETHTHVDGEHHEEVNNVAAEVETTAQIAENVNAEKFKSLIDEGNGLLLDVRTAGEVANGTIEGSTNIDFNSPNFKEEIAKLDKAEPVYVFCASGGRSGNAMRMMKDMGFAEVYNLNGGYMGWPYK